MSKTLKVISPIFTLKEGDTLELSKDENSYKNIHDEQFCRSGVIGSEYESSYHGEFTISSEFAEELVKEGYLSEETENDHPFVNIFNEIDDLLDQYTIDLKSVENDEDSVPACLRVEKMTVLQNMIKLLTHLKSLKK